MTIKIKIIAGFALMVTLMLVVSTIGNRSLSESADLLEEYSRVATINTVTSDFTTHVNDSGLFLERYLRLNNVEDMRTSRRRAADAVAAAEQSLKLAALAQTKQLSAQMLDTAKQMVAALEQLQTAQDSFNAVFEKEILPTTDDMIAATAKLGDLAVNANNVDALNHLNDLWREAVGLKAALNGFDQDSTAKNAQEVETFENNLKKIVQAISATLRTDEGKRTGDELNAQVDKLNGLFGRNKALAVQAEDLRSKIDAQISTLKQAGANISAQMQKRQEESKENASATNARASSLLYAVSGIGILGGLLFAVFIIFNLIKVLRNISRYAEALAQGNLEYDSGIREKGEVGVMVSSLGRIPAALKSILADYRDLERKIEFGRLDAQCDADKYQGGYASMLKATNGVLRRFRMVVDALPSPVITLDADCKTAYCNTEAIRLAGADYRGKSCKQLFRLDDAETPADAIRKALESLRPASGETRAHPGDTDMDVSYTAIPMLGQDGKLASMLQLLTDLTAIKRTQRTIQEVAAKAASIANRVAASSEELSAQVEQVSRGAEMQRGRVESTASAMTEMNSTVLEVARNAGQASEQSEMTKNKANDGAALVDKVVNSINLVNTVASTLQTNMQDLGAQAESIGGVMNVISDIADQTNLLALNAAIEAARAGEAGRGFAVVADEVRKLAEKTMNATKEVGTNITAIQHSARNNIKEVGDAAKAVTEATELANTSGKALAEIVNLASANSAVVASIATAAEEQSATSEEINRSVEEINRIVGETADGMVQASAAVQELSQMAQELNRAMGELH
jgi:methyl-accepting chemotaxis protein